MQTIKELAETLDSLRDGGGEKAAYYLRHLRAMHAANVLKPADRLGNGKTATALYDDVGCVAAHFAVYFLEYMELDTESAYSATAALIKGRGLWNMDKDLLPPSQRHDGYLTPGDNLAAAINGVRAGEDWTLILEKARDLSFRARFEAVGYELVPPSDRVKKALQEHGWADPVPVTTVPATTFIRSMLEKLDN